MRAGAVAFGRVIRGMSTVRQIASLPCKNERPLTETIIANSNVVNLKDGFGL